MMTLLFKRITKRRCAVRVAIEKLVEEHGLYPSSMDKCRLAEVLGKVLNQRPSEFFDRSTLKGYIPNCLNEYRRKTLFGPRIRRTQNNDAADASTKLKG